MRTRWLAIFLALMLWTAPGLAGDDLEKTGASGQPSREDLEVIAVMEILQLMDLAESMEMVKELDVLLEEDQDAHQD